MLQQLAVLGRGWLYWDEPTDLGFEGTLQLGSISKPEPDAVPWQFASWHNNDHIWRFEIETFV